MSEPTPRRLAWVQHVAVQFWTDGRAEAASDTQLVIDVAAYQETRARIGPKAMLVLFELMMNAEVDDDGAVVCRLTAEQISSRFAYSTNPDPKKKKHTGWSPDIVGPLLSELTKAGYAVPEQERAGSTFKRGRRVLNPRLFAVPSGGTTPPAQVCATPATEVATAVSAIPGGGVIHTPAAVSAISGPGRILAGQAASEDRGGDTVRVSAILGPAVRGAGGPSSETAGQAGSGFHETAERGDNRVDVDDEEQHQSLPPAADEQRLWELVERELSALGWSGRRAWLRARDVHRVAAWVGYVAANPGIARNPGAYLNSCLDSEAWPKGCHGLRAVLVDDGERFELHDARGVWRPDIAHTSATSPNAAQPGAAARPATPGAFAAPIRLVSHAQAQEVLDDDDPLWGVISDRTRDLVATGMDRADARAQARTEVLVRHGLVS